MTDKTPAMPEPVGYRHSLTCTLHETEAEVQLADAESEAEPLFTADQMRAYALAALSSQPSPELAVVSDVDDLAQFIRQIDGQNSMGAGALAERICEWLALRPAQQAVPMTEADTVQVYGVKGGKQTLLGTAPMPLRMKARELAREQFGHFEDGDGSDAELCFYALEQLIEHMERSAHHGITAQSTQEGSDSDWTLQTR